MTDMKRFLSVFLCFVMCFSLLPTWAAAQETDDGIVDEVQVEDYFAEIAGTETLNKGDVDAGFYEVTTEPEQEMLLPQQDDAGVPTEDAFDLEDTEYEEESLENEFPEEWIASDTEVFYADVVMADTEAEEATLENSFEMIDYDTAEETILNVNALEESSFTENEQEAFQTEGTLSGQNGQDQIDVTDVMEQMERTEIGSDIEAEEATLENSFEMIDYDTAEETILNVNALEESSFTENEQEAFQTEGTLSGQNGQDQIDVTDVMEQMERTEIGSDIETTRVTSANATSGTLEEGPTWILDDKGLLTISGTGTIGNGAFCGNNAIHELVISDTVTKIGNYAFKDCPNLAVISLPKNITMGNYVFANCSSLVNVEIPEGVESGHSTFLDCTGLKKVKIAESSSIGADGFQNCIGLTSAGPIGSGCSIEFGWTQIPNGAFSGCGTLETVTIPDGTISIGNYAFKECKKLTKISIPKNISMGNYVFEDCISLVNVEVLDGVSSGHSTFMNCTGLKKVIIAESSNVGADGFQNCSGLTSAGPIGSGCSIEFGWTQIPTGAFSSCGSLEKVTIPDSVISIGNNSFKECAGLTELTIPEGVGTIGNYAFDSSGIKTITFLGNCPQIGNSIFQNVTATAYYPANKGWSESDLKDYGGTIKWVATGTPDVKLDKPVLSRIANVKTGVQIKWDKVTDATIYCIYRKGPNDAKWTGLGETKNNSYVDTNVTSGKTYKYAVKAKADSALSDLSAAKSIKYVSLVKISAVSNAKTGVTVKWAKVAGASKYRIWRKAGSGSWKKLADTTKTTFTDKKAKSGIKYSYRIRPMDKNSKYLNTYSAAKTITFVKAPVISVLTAANGKPTFKWAKITGATKYRVFRKGPGDNGWVKLGETNKLKFTDKKATAGVEYTYAVKAYNGSAKTWSAFSTGKSITAK